MGRGREARKNTNNRPFFLEKNRQKKLDKGGRLWYISQARLRETDETSEANLENDTEKRNAQEGKISEDSKEFSIERC